MSTRRLLIGRQFPSARSKGELLVPFVGQVGHLPRFLERCQCVQSGLDDAHLKLSVKWLATLVAQGRVDEYRPGRLHLRHHVSGRTYVDGADTYLFHYSGKQSHGLMVKRSGGDTEEDVDTRPLDFPGYFRRQLGLKSRAPVHTPHAESVVGLGQLPDEPLLLQLPEPVDR